MSLASPVEDAFAMPWELRPVAVRQRPDLQGLVQTKELPVLLAQLLRNHNVAVVRHRDGSEIKGGIKVGCEEQSVEYIEALGVGATVRPGLDVARSKEFGDREPRPAQRPSQ